MSVERELGALRQAIDSNTQAVNRLLDKFDEHVESDNENFGVLKVEVARLHASIGSHAWGALRYAIAAAGALVAGMLGGHVPLPGDH